MYKPNWGPPTRRTTSPPGLTEEQLSNSNSSEIEVQSWALEA